ncbi:MAG: GNAT family N-acetyltransferase [Alphaproteobacteria bacterium]|nr:GNAT family N-acetyltransferase [Alphaproteobacteria bacterium]
MFSVRTIRDARSPANREAVGEVQAILRAQFPGMRESDIGKVPKLLEDPLRYKLVAELLVAENAKGHVRAFAFLLFLTDLKVAFLDTISAAPGGSGGGLGGVLYERVREESLALGAQGLYFECLPDEPELSPNEAVRKQNMSRLKFYERFGARPILGTAYEQPIEPGTPDSPYLVFDGLGRHALPEAETLRRILRAILERKYAEICPPGYIDMVVRSVRPGGYGLRAPRYTTRETHREVREIRRLKTKMPLVVNDRHDIHHVRERGYVEAPVRVASILEEIDKTELFERVPAKRFPERHLREVHDGALVDFIERACAEAPLKKSIYPYTFPIRNPNRKPKDRTVLAGYWCIDTFTPLNRNAYPAARRAIDCTLTAAELVLEGSRAAYALVRPPGHHAERRSFGGFCYFNNAAVAAHYLSRYGRVAVLDLDYHHGNGTQDIFYERDDVLTVSVHGHPSYAYPYFSGFADERGRGRGAGYNLNIPLPEKTSPAEHRAAVAKALARVRRHDPDFLVLAIGFDTGRGDPTGTWANGAADFRALGAMIGEASLPTLVVQEGGYRVRTLGINARNFFAGLSEAAASHPPADRRHARRAAVNGAKVPAWREDVTRADIEIVRTLVAATDMFSSEETAIAAELVEERVNKGRVSGYEFLVAERGSRLVGYSCYGRTPATEASYDLYWIVVRPSEQGHGLGREILARTEAAIKAAGGERVFVDTSSTEKYEPTRAFYRRTGFKKVVELEDFYRPGDGKVIYVKNLSG